MTARRYTLDEKRINLIYNTHYWDQPLSGFATLDGKLTMFKWRLDADKIIVADPPNFITRILLRIYLEYIRISFGSHWDENYSDLPFAFKISRLGLFGLRQSIKKAKRKNQKRAKTKD